MDDRITIVWPGDLHLNKAQKFFTTRISGRDAPLILAPAESFSLEPCTLDYLIIYLII